MYLITRPLKWRVIPVRNTTRKKTMAYRKMITTCGVEGHDEDCLCDVIITKPTPITVTIPQDFRYGQEVVDYLGLGVPWKAEDLLLFLETHEKLVQAIRREQRKPQTEAAQRLALLKSKLTPEQRQHLKDLINQKYTPTQAVNVIKEQYGIVLHRSYVNKLKQRMIVAGEYYAH